MCRIGISNGALISKSEWDYSIKHNPDGVGIACITSDYDDIFVKKGLNINYEDYRQFVEIGNLHCVHFRKASAGEVEEHLCHPFEIKSYPNPLSEFKTISPVLFHNGTIRNWETLLISHIISNKIRLDSMDTWSDTRFIASLVAHHGIGILSIFENQRFVIIHPNGGFTKIGNWQDEKDGIIWSSAHVNYADYGYGYGNRSWLPYQYQKNEPLSNECAVYPKDNKKKEWKQSTLSKDWRKK